MIRIAVGALLLMANSAVSWAQSDRVGNRIDERLGGRIEQGGAPPIRGVYGPDPYVGPGSVSPFTRAPVVPMISAPIRAPSDPYTSRYPSTDTSRYPSTERSLPREPAIEQSTPDVTTPPRPQESLSPREPQNGQNTPQSTSQKPPTEPGIGRKLGSELKEEPATDAAQNGQSRRQSLQAPLKPGSAKQDPCIGAVKTMNGDCSRAFK